MDTAKQMLQRTMENKDDLLQNFFAFLRVNLKDWPAQNIDAFIEDVFALVTKHKPRPLPQSQGLQQQQYPPLHLPGPSAISTGAPLTSGTSTSGPHISGPQPSAVIQPHLPPPSSQAQAAALQFQQQPYALQQYQHQPLAPQYFQPLQPVPPPQSSGSSSPWAPPAASSYPYAPLLQQQQQPPAYSSALSRRGAKTVSSPAKKQIFDLSSMSPLTPQMADLDNTSIPSVSSFNMLDTPQKDKEEAPRRGI